MDQRHEELKLTRVQQKAHNIRYYFAEDKDRDPSDNKFVDYLVEKVLYYTAQFRRRRKVTKLCYQLINEMDEIKRIHIEDKLHAAFESIETREFKE